MSKSKMSKSHQWRKMGNDFYQKAQGPLVNTKYKQERLSEALKCYYEALKSGINDQEWASAYKNVAMASWNLAKTFNNFTMLLHHSRNAVEHFDRGFQFGCSAMTIEWREMLLNSYRQCVQGSVDQVIQIEGSDSCNSQIRLLEVLVPKMSDQLQALKSECYLQIGQLIFNKIVTELPLGNYQEALSGTKDCYHPIEETKRLGRGTVQEGYFLSEISILEEDVRLHTCIAESMQARDTGDKLLKLYHKETDFLNMTMIYEVMDWYKKAILLTREQEFEMEAIALSRLGSVYEVLKLKAKAKECFMRSVQLAHSMHPRTFNTDEWFEKATQALKDYQKQVLREEETKWQAARKKYIEELKEELKALKSHENDTPQNLATFLYDTYPPKGNNKKPTDKELKLPTPEFKKLFMKVILAYHPDKQGATHGEKWKVLCEEISKTLNNKYTSHFKRLD